MTRFVALFDGHYGKERQGSKFVELHDPKAIEATLGFVTDFRPDVIILGGDWLDCGVISHHNKGKTRRVEGLRLLQDMEGLRKDVLLPLEATSASRLVYHVGNHERWLDDFIEENPGVEGIVALKSGLGLSSPRWTIVDQGGVSRLGKLHFIHGDQCKTANPAKWAVATFARSIRFGHYHRAMLHTKISALDLRDVHTGMSVPCLCRRDPAYGRGSPNGWAQGFLYGYVHPNGDFNDFLVMISNHRFVAEGKEYRG